MFQYIERKPSNTNPTIQQFTLDNYPSELHKKVTLLKHFRNYLSEQTTSATITTNNDNTFPLPSNNNNYNNNSNNNSNNNNTYGNTNGELPYVKKWVRTKHAILFRLSNRTVQVVFYDHR